LAKTRGDNDLIPSAVVAVAIL